MLALAKNEKIYSARMDGWTGVTGEARELVEGVPSSTPFTSPAPPHPQIKSPLPAQDDPLRAEIAQIMGEARSRAERAVQADPARSSDSEGGIRLHIFGQPTDSGEGFSLMAVEATRMCQRGVSEGRCV